MINAMQEKVGTYKVTGKDDFGKVRTWTITRNPDGSGTWVEDGVVVYTYTPQDPPQSMESWVPYGHTVEWVG